jgi:2-dehydro-3-deoxyphosphogluconate aldolase/(4S)-4-hydroxy-2-oxoglutarate aldolase
MRETKRISTGTGPSAHPTSAGERTDGARAMRRKLVDSKLIAILRGSFELEQLEQVAEALVAGGVTFIEVTLNSVTALEGIRHLSGDPRVVVGAGTVRTVEDAGLALDVGARFLVSPHLDPELVAFAQRNDSLHLPGVLTPSEVQRAVDLGCGAVKLFPASFGGPEYLRALKAPLDDVDFIPTGGVDETNLEAYLRAGAAAVGLGSSLSHPGRPSYEVAAGAARAVEILRRVCG